jgi:hypothetical protein
MFQSSPQNVAYAADRQAMAKARYGCAAIAGCGEKAMLLVNYKILSRALVQRGIFVLF